MGSDCRRFTYRPATRFSHRDVRAALRRTPWGGMPARRPEAGHDSYRRNASSGTDMRSSGGVEGQNTGNPYDCVSPEVPR